MISDTTSFCIHCGAPFRPKTKKEQLLYSRLPEARRTELESTFFYKLHPEHNAARQKFASVVFCEKNLIISLGVICFFVIIAAICSFINAAILTGFLFLCALLLSVYFTIMAIICFIIIKAIKLKRLKRMLTAIKRYETWLAEEHNIMYSPHFNKEMYASLYSKIN